MKLRNKTAKSGSSLPTCSPGFEPIRVTIIEGAWKDDKGWITGPKNEVDANPITTDGGICLCWFDSEIRRENVRCALTGAIERKMKSNCKDYGRLSDTACSLVYVSV